MSVAVSEIDRFLTQEEASAPSTWLPASVRAILAEDASLDRHAHPSHPPVDPQAAHVSTLQEVARPHWEPAKTPLHHDDVKDGIQELRLSSPIPSRKPMARVPEVSKSPEMTKCGLARPDSTYGSTDDPLPWTPRQQMEILNPKYKRVEKVVIAFGLILAAIFGCALTTGGPINDTDWVSPASEQKLTQVSGFGCGSFLCPHSGSCVMEARACPEGNPFMRRSGIYHELVNCAGPGVCDCKSNPDAEHMCKKGIVGFSALNNWGTKAGAGCGGFLCPGSGVCRRAPTDCEEGSPFVREGSIYTREAVAAKAKVQAQRKAADKLRSKAVAAKLEEEQKAKLRARAEGGSAKLKGKGSEELAASPLLQEAATPLRSSKPAAAHEAAGGHGDADRKQAEAKEVERQEKALAASIQKSNSALAQAIYQHEHDGAGR